MRYIGSKSNLIGQISDLLHAHINGNEQSFLDVFAGTNVVGSYFKAIVARYL
jgi:adenine-specific DNA-methyltransferase